MQEKTTREEGNKLRLKNQAGFSLLEMLFSIIIFSVVIAAVYGLLQVARAGRNMSSERSDLMKQMRYTLNLMGRDALNAGYSYHKNGAVIPDNLLNTRLGLPADINTTRDLLVGIVAGNNINSNSLQTGTTQNTDVVSFIYRDVTFYPNPTTGSSQTMTVTSANESPSTVTNLNLGFGAVTTNNCRINDLYLVDSGTTTTLVMATAIPSTTQIAFAATDPLSLNQTYTNSVLQACVGTNTSNCTTYNATLKRVIWIAFKVKNDGTLVRLVFGNNGTSSTQIQEQPLAYGIENLQIKYLMDDGTTTDDPAAGPDGINGNADDTPPNLNLVRQIRFTITARGNDVDPRTGQRNRITMTSTFSTRNMGYNAG